MAFDLSKYSEVKDRLPKFWEKFPNGAVITELVENELKELKYPSQEEGGEPEVEYLARVVFKCSLFTDRADTANSLISTGYAMETDVSSKIDKFFENTETSAIGRALANAGFSGYKDEPRPSREEMASAGRAKVVNSKLFGKKNG